MNVVVLISAALAVFFLMLVVVNVLSRALDQYAAEYVAKRVSDLSEMFFFVGREQLMLLTVALTAAAAIVGLLVAGPVLTVVLVVAGLASPTVLVRFYRARRIKLFDRQLVDALAGMASAFRAGMTLYQAMEEVARSAPAPLSQELALTVREIRVGTSTDDALENLANRVGSDDLRLVVTSINTARSFGGNMAEMLDTIAATIRERFRIEGRVRALTAQGRLQGVIIGLMPIFVWVAFDFIRPDLTRPMMSHWFGVAVVGLVISMEVIGALLIRRVVTIRV
ncbi:MAG: type II secretion system F family protein [Myxococcota bacterium]|nr:type II secretion system F family protein [Myxococcota bacterium]